MYIYKINVERVIDGDTIDGVVDLGFDISLKMRFRLAHINTPETRSKDKEEVKRGNAAKARLEELIADRETVVKSEKSLEPDKYGRWLANVYVVDDSKQGFDVCVNEVLLNEGHATAYEGGKR